ncbi:hypothetical protein C8J56DRAFT_902443 [Mycena floridula]|nr:hypothetical protein C8J56DRAFT_902443 [Mycena floridula]
MTVTSLNMEKSLHASFVKPLAKCKTTPDFKSAYLENWDNVQCWMMYLMKNVLEVPSLRNVDPAMDEFTASLHQAVMRPFCRFTEICLIDDERDDRIEVVEETARYHGYSELLIRLWIYGGRWDLNLEPILHAMGVMTRIFGKASFPEFVDTMLDISDSTALCLGSIAKAANRFRPEKLTTNVFLSIISLAGFFSDITGGEQASYSLLCNRFYMADCARVVTELLSKLTLELFIELDVVAPVIEMTLFALYKMLRSADPSKGIIPALKAGLMQSLPALLRIAEHHEAVGGTWGSVAGNSPKETVLLTLNLIMANISHPEVLRETRNGSAISTRSC